MSLPIKRLQRSLLPALQGLEVVAEWSCRGAIVVMAGLVLLQVVLRYVFLAPLMWVEEASIFLMIWMTFVGAGIALRRGSHVAMTMLCDRLPSTWSRIVSAVSTLFILAFLLVVIWQGWLLSMFVQNQPSPALRIPMMWPYLIIPLGAAFMIIQVVAMILSRESKVSSPESSIE